MRISQLATLIALVLSIFATICHCFPSKPLNERSTELTWQAWLLIDETQNKQQQQQQDATLRRRITPKSVFIAPTFSPESLPECSEGYQSDSMGRCIKIIMLNKERHLDFLLNQLNQKFGGMLDYEDEEDVATTSGPFNINIPLNAAEIQEETDVAIVVAPSNNELLLKNDEAEMQIQLNKTLSEEKVNVDAIAGILGLKKAEQVETTTITSSTNTDDTTTQISTTTKMAESTLTNTEVTTELDALFFLDQKRQVELKNIENLASTTSETTTTDNNGFKDGDSEAMLSSYVQQDQALPDPESFVQFDVKREAIVRDNHENKHEITSEMPETIKFNSLVHNVRKDSVTNFKNRAPESHRIASTSTTMTMTDVMLTPIDDNSLVVRVGQDGVVQTQTTQSSSSKSFFPEGFQKPNYETLYNVNNIRFFLRPERKQTETEPTTTTMVQETSETPTETTEIYTTTTVFDDEVKTTTYVDSITTTEVSSETESNNLVKFPTDAPKLVRFPTEGQLVRRRNNLDVSIGQLGQVLPLKNNPTHVDLSQTLYQRYKAHRDNHRNREKHSEWFHLPAKWSDNSQKPVVLRFSRKHGYIDSQQLGSNNFYREINPRMFGFPLSKSTVQR